MKNKQKKKKDRTSFAHFKNSTGNANEIHMNNIFHRQILHFIAFRISLGFQQISTVGYVDLYGLIYNNDF